MIVLYIILALMMTEFIIERLLNKDSIKYKYLHKNKFFVYLQITLGIIILYYLLKSFEKVSCREGYVCYCLKSSSQLS